MMAISRAGLVAVALSMALTGCGTVVESDEPAQGEEGGACYPNETCNEPLLCLSDTCVRPRDASVSPDAEGQDPDADPDPSAPDAGAAGAGQFELTWQICEYGQDTPCEPATCEEVGADAVAVGSTREDDGATFEDLFGCPPTASEGDVTTSVLAVGDYELNVELRDDDDAVLAESEEFNDTIFEDGVVVDLGIVEFVFE